MTTITSDTNNLWKDLSSLIISEFDRIKLDGSINIRVLGVFDSHQKPSVINRLDMFGIKADQCEIYHSAIEEENRMDLLVSIKPKKQ